MMTKPFITPLGYQRLSDELAHLLRVRRPELTRAVGEAAALGDRSENAEYIYGKKLLREADRRIRFLQKRLPDLKVIDRLPDDPSRIYFGAHVDLEDTQGNRHHVRLVSADEIDPHEHWISIQAPMARALLGKQADDEVTVQLPTGGHAHYWIVRHWYTVP